MKKVLIPNLVEDKAFCCGCAACYVACPQNAIVMIEDLEGFLYPSISTNKCVGCHLCLKACQFKKDIQENTYAK